MHTDNRVLWEKAATLRGCLSDLKTKTGRRRYPEREQPFECTDPFVADEDKLLASKTFRNMGDKTQVFTAPRSSLVRTRMTHVLEVVGTTVLACEILGLNTNLARAAAIGHDVGHVPLGHQGEKYMARAMSRPEFCHEVMGPIVTQRIERAGRGLNLTRETLEAMMRHSGNFAQEGMSPEAWVLRHTDKATYLFHDLNDIGKRVGFPLPKEVVDIANTFGANQRERRSTAISALVVESAEMGRVSFEHSDFAKLFKRLRTLMYEVYPRVTRQNVENILGPILEYLDMLKLGDPFLLLALLTDKEVSLLSDRAMTDATIINQLPISEIIPHLEAIGPIDLCNPGLDW